MPLPSTACNEKRVNKAKVERRKQSDCDRKNTQIEVRERRISGVDVDGSALRDVT